MTSPADHAALDALQAQAETALEAEYARGYEQGIQLLASAEAERDRLAARVEELEAALLAHFLDPLESHGGRAHAREILGIPFIPFATPQEMLERAALDKDKP